MKNSPINYCCVFEIWIEVYSKKLMVNFARDSCYKTNGISKLMEKYICMRSRLQRSGLRSGFGIDHSASFAAHFHTEFRVTSILLSLFSLTVCMPSSYKFFKEKIEVGHS